MSEIRIPHYVFEQRPVDYLRETWEAQQRMREVLRAPAPGQPIDVRVLMDLGGQHHTTTKDKEPSMTMDMSLTVDREKMIAALREKRDEIAADYEASSEQTSADDTLINEAHEALAAHYRALADVIEAGDADLTYTGNRGEEVRAVPRRGVEIPSRPKFTNALARAVERRRQAESNKSAAKRATAPYDAALQLLEMSTDDKVGVPAAEYQRLLAGQVDRDFER